IRLDPLTIASVAQGPSQGMPRRLLWQCSNELGSRPPRTQHNRGHSFMSANRERKMTDITDIRKMKARIIVFGVGGAGGNAINNMIAAGLQGVDFIVANTDAQA